jgi:hypothetical protein
MLRIGRLKQHETPHAVGCFYCGNLWQMVEEYCDTPVLAPARTGYVLVVCPKCLAAHEVVLARLSPGGQWFEHRLDGKSAGLMLVLSVAS